MGGGVSACTGVGFRARTDNSVRTLSESATAAPRSRPTTRRKFGASRLRRSISVLIGTHLSLPHHHHLPVSAPHPASLASLASHRLLKTPLKSLRASPTSRTPTSAQSASDGLRLKTPQKSARVLQKAPKPRLWKAEGWHVLTLRFCLCPPPPPTRLEAAESHSGGFRGSRPPAARPHRPPPTDVGTPCAPPASTPPPLSPTPARAAQSRLGVVSFADAPPRPTPASHRCLGRGPALRDTPTTAPPLALVVDVGAALESRATAARVHTRSRTTPTPCPPPFQAGRGNLFATAAAPPLPLPTRAAALSFYYANPRPPPLPPAAGRLCDSPPTTAPPLALVVVDVGGVHEPRNRGLACLSLAPGLLSLALAQIHVWSAIYTFVFVLSSSYKSM
ncbi:hypothetical protein C8R43DRAFT_1140346 [Mycena crocata]|nr:hypothetical protein C8R43DRAFT_1140346 [Mycena crocata]